MHTTVLTPRLTISNILTDQSTIAGGKLPEGSLVVTTINGQPVGTGDPAQLLGGGCPVTISRLPTERRRGEHLGFRDSPCPGIKDGYPTENEIKVSWIMGVIRASVA